MGGANKIDFNKLNDKDYKGEDFQVDTELDDGPLSDDKRSCTDILFYILFVLFVIGMLVIMIYAYVEGNPAKFFSPIDDDGNFCGYTDGYEDYDKLYWPDLSSSFAVENRYVCIKGGCPDETSGNIECIPTNEVPDCNHPSFQRYNSNSFLTIYCLPDKNDLPATISAGYDYVWNFIDIESINQYVYDMGRGWPVILIGAFVTFILCIAFIYLIEYFAAALAWICIIGSFLALAGLGFYFYFTKDRNEEDDDQENYNLAYAIICWVAAGLILLLVCCFCKSFRIAIAVVQATADFITDTKRILLIPIIGFIITLVFYAIWISVAIFVYTIGDIEGSGGQGREVEWEESTRRVWYYHFFGLFWINAMLDACTSFIVIVAACTWYFSHGSEVEGTAQVGKGFRWIWRYHCGSLALGSLILAIIQVIRFMFEQFRKRAEAANPGNAVLTCLLRAVSYLIACLNRCIKFINRNAYIQVALRSTHFCLSAFNAFILILRNGVRFTFVEYLAFIFAILGKILIICLTCLLCYFILDIWDDMGDRLSSFFPVLFIVALISYVVCQLFFSIFAIGGNTILQCFILDEEISNATGKGSAGHQPPALRKFIRQIKKDKGEQVSDSDSSIDNRQ